jgi:uncharacterized membrane protein YbaN (DUF454 family)
MKTRLKRALLLIAGWGFILVGIVGLFLPVLQGVLFILVGLTLLSTQYSWAHRLLTHARNRFPKITHAADSAAEKTTGWLRRIFHPGGAD